MNTDQLSFIIGVINCLILTKCKTLELNSSSLQNAERMIGGIQAGQTQFPWIVELRLTSGLADLIGSRSCAASILNVNWLVTTAPCASSINSRYRVYAGINDLSFPNFYTLQNRLVSRKVIHPKYNPKTGENNIGLLRVIPAFAFDNATVGSIQYVHYNFVANGTGLIAGWGSRDESDYEGSRYLMFGSVPIITNTECQETLKRPIYPTQLCTTGTSSSPCYGDEGGPLMCSRNGVNLLCGIISETRNCSRGVPPKVFTRMSPFYDWLQVVTTS